MPTTKDTNSIDLENFVTDQGSYAMYIKTLIEKVCNDYFVYEPTTEEVMQKISYEYTTIKHLLEIAHDYALKIMEEAEKYELL